MKSLITCLTLIISVLGYSQSNLKGQINSNTPMLENISFVVTVDSLEEIESTFKIEDIKEIMESSDNDETISFKIICNNKNIKDGLKPYTSYEVKGNTDDKKTFLKLIRKIKKSAIKYYNS